IRRSSRGSRPILRTQPQLRLDCSAARAPFSQSTTGMLRSARNIAVLTPMMPPPITTTSVARGGFASVGESSTGGPEWPSSAASTGESDTTPGPLEWIDHLLDGRDLGLEQIDELAKALRFKTCARHVDGDRRDRITPMGKDGDCERRNPLH